MNLSLNFIGEYCDAQFLKATQKELAEALDMTPEEMDRAAHQLLQVENALCANEEANTSKSKYQPNSPPAEYSEEEEDTRL